MSFAGAFLFLMLAAHVVCDFNLQPGYLSAAKRPGGDPCLPWQIALGAHSLIHGGAVAAIAIALGRGELWWLGLAETAAHAAIDGAKCRGLFGMKIDQGLHLACKLAWLAIALVVPHG